MGLFQFAEFSLGGVPCTNCVFTRAGEEGEGELEGEIFYIHNLNLDTSQSLNARSRLPVQANIASNFYTVILLSCQKSTQWKHNQVSDKSKWYCIKWDSVPFFGMMFREISILLIHYPCNKIHSWHVVDQVLSQRSASDLPVANMGPKGQFN